jgi:hypothetical protein
MGFTVIRLMQSLMSSIHTQSYVSYNATSHWFTHSSMDPCPWVHALFNAGPPPPKIKSCIPEVVSHTLRYHGENTNLLDFTFSLVGPNPFLHTLFGLVYRTPEATADPVGRPIWNISGEHGISLSGSYRQGYSTTYNTQSHIKVVCNGYILTHISN